MEGEKGWKEEKRFEEGLKGRKSRSVREEEEEKRFEGMG